MTHCDNRLLIPIIIGLFSGVNFFRCNTEKEIKYYPSKESLREFELVDLKTGYCIFKFR